MANKVTIFVSPYIGEVNRHGEVILDALDMQQCKDIGIPLDVRFEKTLPNLPESMMLLKKKLLKIQEILDE